MKLSKRLQVVASFIPDNSSLYSADTEDAFDTCLANSSLKTTLLILLILDAVSITFCFLSAIFIRQFE